MLPSKEERERARRAAQNSKPYKSAQEKWWEEHQKKETAEREKRKKEQEERKRAAAENARKKADEREAEVMSNPKLNDAQKAEFRRLKTVEKDQLYEKLRVMAGSTFTPIPSGQLPGRLAHGAPPASSQVYAAPQQLQSTDEFEDDDDETSGGWGRISPEYRNYTYLKVTLAPDGVATLDLDDGVYCNPATGYEFRGTMPYRVTEGAVVFYVDAIELAAAAKWKLPRGPGGKRVDREPHKLIPDERTPAALFEDAWNGVRESRKCNFESSYKLKDVLWPAAALVELKSAAVVELS